MLREQEQFKFRFSRPSEIKGLTPEIANDLYDIVRKFGQVSPEEQAVRFRSGNIGLGFELFITASIKPDNHNMLVRKGDTVSSANITLVQARRATIMWDRTLSVEEARRAIIRIDEEVALAGLIDPQTKKRKPIPAEQAINRSTVLYAVDSVFTTPDAGFMVLPGQDPRRVLQQFDHPERLEIVLNPMGGVTITLKESLPRLQKRAKIVDQVLREQGIDMTNPRDIDRLSLSDIAALRLEIQRRMQEAEKQSENPSHDPLTK